MGEAETLFREAEALQKERESDYPLLYSVQGFLYCDLLQGQGKYQNVRDRVARALEWIEQVGQGSLLDVAVDHLSLGRAHLAETRRDETRNFSTAAEHLDQAVDGLRQAGMQEYISRGLLARAALYRVRREFEPARRDLDEALSIAERGQMGLYRADAHLESARLDLAMANKPEAREHLATAKEMIERMGYHRRDGEVVELEERLKAG